MFYVDDDLWDFALYTYYTIFNTLAKDLILVETCSVREDFLFYVLLCPYFSSYTISVLLAYSLVSLYGVGVAIICSHNL